MRSHPEPSCVATMKLPLSALPSSSPFNVSCSSFCNGSSSVQGPGTGDQG